MRAGHGLLLAAASAVGIAAPASAQRDFSAVEIATTELGGGVYMLVGAGGNLGLSVGEDGAFLIDDQFAPLTDKITAAVAAVSDKPIEFVVNTHWHYDHTGGNENLGKAGAHIVAHDNVRARLKAGLDRGDGNVTPPSPDVALPVITFAHSLTFHWNGQTVQAVHPGATTKNHHAHTDGDAFVYFKEANVIHMGDVFFNGGFPFIDLASGGGLDGYIAAQEFALTLTNADTKIIPGHGPLAARSDLEASVAMLKEVRSRIAALIADGKTAEEIAAAKPLADLDAAWGQGFINAERMTGFAVASLMAAAHDH
ncbi:MAG: MBL fold metallo-hydrolase [Alphaproteobacteria bacterium]|nr:MBL fold metallo-hydrolase [Alphaproteobacteria bacterium]